MNSSSVNFSYSTFSSLMAGVEEDSVMASQPNPPRRPVNGRMDSYILRRTRTNSWNFSSWDRNTERRRKEGKNLRVRFRDFYCCCSLLFFQYHYIIFHTQFPHQTIARHSHRRSKGANYIIIPSVSTVNLHSPRIGRECQSVHQDLRVAWRNDRPWK